MSRILEVLRYELRRGGRRKGYLAATFGVPLAGIALVIAIRLIGTLPAFNSTQMIAQAMEQVELGGIQTAGLVDQSGRFAPLAAQAGQMQVFAGQEAANAALRAGELDGYYLIPADYMDTGSVTLVLPGMDVNRISGQPVRALIIETLSENVDAEIVARLQNPANITVTNLSLTTGSSSAADEMNGGAFVLIYVLAMMLMMSLFVTNGYLMQSVIEEKETRLIEILLASVRPTQLLAGKILANGILGLFQLLMWMAGMVIGLRLAGGEELGQTLSIFASLANIQLPLDVLPMLLIFFVLAYLMFAGFYGMIGAVSNSMREGPQYAALLTLPVAVPLMFMVMFIEDPSGGFATALSMFPLTSPLAMPMRLVISTVPAWQILLSMALLALTAVGMIWAAGRVFRVQVLLAGKLPRLRDLPALVRGG